MVGHLNTFETVQKESAFCCPSCKRDLFEKVLVNRYGEVSLAAKAVQPMVYIRCLHCGWSTQVDSQ